MDDSGRRTSLYTIGAVVTSLGALALVYLSARGPQNDPCQALVRQLDGTWNEARGDALSRSLVGSGLSFASRSAATVRSVLDRYAQTWRASAQVACSTSASTPRCLEDDLAKFARLVNLLEQDETLVERAVAGAVRLSGVKGCADVLDVDALTPADVWVLIALGQTEAAQARVADELEQQHPPAVHAALVYWQGRRARIVGESERAQTLLQEAEAQATGAEQAGLRLVASLELAKLYALELDKPAAAGVWLGRAQDLAQPSDDIDPRWRLQLLRTRGEIDRRSSDPSAALIHYEQALELALHRWGPDHPAVGWVEAEASLASLAAADRTRAMTQHQRAVRRLSSALGSTHPQLGTVIEQFAQAQLAAGDRAGGIETLNRAIAVFEASTVGGSSALEATLLLAEVWANSQQYEQVLGSYRRARAYRQGDADSPVWEQVALGMGTAHLALGDPSAALREFEAAVGSRQRRLGESSPMLAGPLGRVAHAQEVLEQPAAAFETRMRALELLRPTGDDPRLMDALLAAAQAALGAEQHAAGLRLATEAVNGLTRQSPPDLARLLDGLAYVGTACLGLGRDAEAAEAFTRGVDLAAALGGEQQRSVSLRLGLATAQWKIGQTDTATDNARSALATSRAFDDPSIAALAEAWLTRRGLPL